MDQRQKTDVEKMTENRQKENVGTLIIVHKYILKRKKGKKKWIGGGGWEGKDEDNDD